MPEAFGRAQSGFPHDLINDMDHDSLHHNGKRSIQFRLRNFEQKRLRNHFRMKGGSRYVKTGQIHSQKEGQKLEDTRKSRIKRSVRIIVEALKILKEEMRQHNHIRRSVD